MSMQATKRSSQWISPQISQGTGESDWIEQQSSIEGVLGSVQKLTGTNATQLVCWDFEVSEGERFVVRQNSTVYEGVASLISSRMTQFSTNSQFFNTTYDNVYFDTTAQEAVPLGGAFSVDGTKLYVCGRTAPESVYQYTLTTPWDVGTATYDAKSVDVSVEEANPVDVEFSNDGTTLYVVGSSLKVNQYTLSTPWDIATATYTSAFDLSASITVLSGIDFNSDGTKLYLSINNSEIRQYNLTVAWDVSTANSTAAATLNLSTNVTSMLEILFNSIGTSLYVLDSGKESVFEYNLSTPFDINTAKVGSSLYLEETGNTVSILFGDSDNKMYAITEDPTNSLSGVGIYQYTVPENIEYKQENTINLTDFGLAEAPQYVFTRVPEMRICLEDTTPRCVSRDIDLYMYGTSTNQIQVIYPETLNQVVEAGDLITVDEGDVSVTSVVDTGTTITDPVDPGISFSVGTQSTSPWTIRFSSDGTKMFVGGSNDMLYQYTLSTAWNPSTATYDGISVDFVHTNGRFVFSSNGKSLYFIRGDDRVEYVDVPVPFDLTSIYKTINTSDDSQTISVGSQETNPMGLAFSSDGFNMYIVGTTYDTVFQYKLSVAWDITTAVYTNKAFSVSNQEPNPYDITFSPDGYKMFIIGANRRVHEYHVLVAWDITTAVYKTFFDISKNETSPKGMTFSTDGSSLYIVGGSSDTVYQYNLPIPFSVGGDKIWNINLPLAGIPTFAYIKDRSEILPYTRTPVAGSVEQVSVSLSTAGSINHTFDSQSFETTPRRAIQLSVIAGTDTTVNTMKSNLWKAGTPTL